MENNLSVSEKFFLLCVRPDKGGLVGGGAFTVLYSLKACIIKELELKGNIIISNGFVEIKTFKSDVPLLEFVLSKFKNFDKPIKLTRWFSRLYYSINYIKNEIRSGLVEKRLIRIEKRRFLIFTYNMTCLTEKSHAREIADKIKGMIYRGEVEEDWKFLVSLVEPAGLLSRLFPERQSRKNARRRLKQMNLDCEIAKTVKKVIAGTRAAMAS
ncbi:MAG: GPP34 family phosphoprotein [Prolixibacteraceae bacterium]|nr:GPP34 family phosphoprotein [Prolixibacteraceae bacterium]MBN2772932.1 GPP34 family phosphoprotein [Prolixibacteraceae bacterium]